jgi:hypothetical protein
VATAKTAAPKAKKPAKDKAAQSARSKKKAATIKAAAAARGKSCSVSGCKRPYRAKGYCVTHYSLWRRSEGELKKQRYKTCSKEECKKPMVKWGLCDEHFKAASKKEGAGASA